MSNEPSGPAALSARFPKHPGFFPTLLASVLIGGMFHGGLHLVEEMIKEKGMASAPAPKKPGEFKTKSEEFAAIYGKDLPAEAEQVYQRLLQSIEGSVKIGTEEFKAGGYDGEWYQIAKDAPLRKIIMSKLELDGFVVDEECPTIGNRCELIIDLTKLKK